MEFFRHGDIILIARRVPDGATRRSELGRLVLAEGEVTGHAHVIDSDEAELWTVPDEAAEARTAMTERMFLRVLAEGGVSLVHEEHAALLIPPGEYEVLRQREWTDELEPRWVVD